MKIIGATSHYAPTELDAGPIIEQDVVRITHKDAIEDLVNKGKDLEKIVLSRAVQKHIERKVLAYKNKTVYLADESSSCKIQCRQYSFCGLCFKAVGGRSGDYC